VRASNEAAHSTSEGVRALIGDGCFGGEYQKPDAIMLALWKVGVEETPEVLDGPWGR
jgi:creatinine amidohydrolase